MWEGLVRGGEKGRGGGVGYGLGFLMGLKLRGGQGLEDGFPEPHPWLWAGHNTSELLSPDCLPRKYVQLNKTETTMSSMT